MIDEDGVVIVHGDETEHVTIDRWEEEYNYHCKMRSIRFFALFEKWKPFYVWRSKVRAKKFHLARESLQNRLFFVNPVCHWSTFSQKLS